MAGEAIDQQKAVPTGAPRRTYTVGSNKNNGKIITKDCLSTVIYFVCFYVRECVSFALFLLWDQCKTFQGRDI